MKKSTKMYDLSRTKYLCIKQVGTTQEGAILDVWWGTYKESLNNPDIKLNVIPTPSKNLYIQVIK